MHIRKPEHAPIQGAAWFSTGGGNREPRAAAMPSMPCLARSDNVKDTYELIRKLRVEWPVFCHSIFPGWDIRDFWDEHDFYLYGGEFLYNTIYKIMEQNVENVARFCYGWSEAHKSQWLSVCSLFTTPEALSTGTIFNDLDRQTYGEVFLGYALNHLVSTYHRTCQSESEQTNALNTKQNGEPVNDTASVDPSVQPRIGAVSTLSDPRSHNSNFNPHLISQETPENETESSKIPSQDENTGLRRSSDSIKHSKACTPRMPAESLANYFSPEPKHGAHHVSGSPYQNQLQVKPRLGPSESPKGHLVTYYNPHVSPGTVYSNMDTVTMFVTQSPSQAIHYAGLQPASYHQSPNVIPPYLASHHAYLPSYAHGNPNQQSTKQRPPVPFKEPLRSFQGDDHTPRQYRTRRGSNDFGRLYRGSISRGRGRAGGGNSWREPRRSSLGQTVETNDSNVHQLGGTQHITVNSDLPHMSRQGRDMQRVAEGQLAAAKDYVPNPDNPHLERIERPQSPSVDTSAGSTMSLASQACGVHLPNSRTSPSNKPNAEHLGMDHSGGTLIHRPIFKGVDISGLLSLFVGNVGSSSHEQVLEALSTKAKVTRVTIQEKNSMPPNQKGFPKFNRFAFAEFVDSEETKKMLEAGVVLCGDRRLDCQIPNRWLQEKGYASIEKPEFNHKASPGRASKQDTKKVSSKDPMASRITHSTRYTSQDVRSSIYPTSHFQRQAQEPDHVTPSRSPDIESSDEKTEPTNGTSANKSEHIVCLPTTLKLATRNAAITDSSLISTLRLKDIESRSKNTDDSSKCVHEDNCLNSYGQRSASVLNTDVAQRSIQESLKCSTENRDQQATEYIRTSTQAAQLSIRQSLSTVEEVTGLADPRSPQNSPTRHVLMDIPEHEALEMPGSKSPVSSSLRQNAELDENFNSRQTLVTPNSEVRESQEASLDQTDIDTGLAPKTGGVYDKGTAFDVSEDTRKSKKRKTNMKKLSTSMKTASHKEATACAYGTRDLTEYIKDGSKVEGSSTLSLQPVATNTLPYKQMVGKQTATSPDINLVDLDNSNEVQRVSSNVTPLQEWNREYESASTLIQHLKSSQRQPLMQELEVIKAELKDLEDRISDATLKASQGTMSIRKKNLKRIKTATEHHKAKIEELVFFHARIMHEQVKLEDNAADTRFEAKTSTVFENNIKSLKKAPRPKEDLDAFLPYPQDATRNEVSDPSISTTTCTDREHDKQKSRYSPEFDRVYSDVVNDQPDARSIKKDLSTLSNDEEVRVNQKGQDAPVDSDERLLDNALKLTARPISQENRSTDESFIATEIGFNIVKPSNNDTRPGTISWAKVAAGTSSYHVPENQAGQFQPSLASKPETSSATATELVAAPKKLQIESKPSALRTTTNTDPWCVPAKDVWQRKAE